MHSCAATTIVHHVQGLRIELTGTVACTIGVRFSFVGTSFQHTVWLLGHFTRTPHTVQFMYVLYHVLDQTCTALNCGCLWRHNKCVSVLLHVCQ